MISKRNSYVKRAFDMGYRVREDGTVVTNTNKVRKTNVGKTCTDGYNLCYFSLRFPENKTARNVMVHKLCAYQQFGEKVFEPNVVVRHLNGVSTDNSFSNIAVGSHSDNMNDKPEELRVHQSVVAARVLRKFTYEEAMCLRQRYADGESMMSLAKESGVSKSTMSYLLRGITYSTYQ